MRDAAGQANRRGSWAVPLAVLWIAVYGHAAWPTLSGPLSGPTLLAHGALPTPLGWTQGPRLLTTWLIHVDPLHLLGNLTAWGVAWLPRPHRPSHRLTAFALCGLGASLAVVFFYGQQPTISAGPSGALLGLLVGLLVQHGVAPWTRAVWLLTSTALLGGGLLTGGDTAAHLGGLVTGLGLGLGVRAASQRGTTS